MNTSSSDTLFKVTFERFKGTHFAQPSQSAPFVGREAELAAVQNHLSDPNCRLLTLIGPGGIGKTRLALEAASQAQGHINGAYFIPLQPLTSPDLIVPALAEALQFQFDKGDSKPQLLEFLSNLNLLLLLDNFEHLLDGVDLLREILERAPFVKLLVTSRERLNLSGEWIFEVGGLNFPPHADAANLDAYSAIQLFTQNARRVQPDFALANEAKAVADICALLEGMPLAIEHAASWVRALSCADILAQMQRGLDILETPTRDVPKRHRSMRAVLDTSWERLSEVEQKVFMRLSVFQGGFTLAAAEAITGATPPALYTLIDQSWLRRDAQNGRYSLHELLRQYGAEKLEQTGQTDAARTAHSRYFADFMREREGHIYYRRQIEAHREIETDFENMRAAWNWTIQQNDLNQLDRMIECMLIACDFQSRWQEGATLMANAADQISRYPDYNRLIYARLRTRYLRFLLLGEIPTFEDILAELQANLRIAQEFEHDAEIAYALYTIGSSYSFRSDNRPATYYLERAFMAFTDLNQRYYMALCAQQLAVTVSNPNSPSLHFFAADIQRDIGDENQLTWTLKNIAWMMFYVMRDFEKCQRYANEAIALNRKNGHWKILCLALTEHSRHQFEVANFDKARAGLEEALQIIPYLNLAHIYQTILGRLALIEIVAYEHYNEGKQQALDTLARAPSWEKASLDGRIDIAFGLGIIAYLEKDITALQRNYMHMAEDTLKTWMPSCTYLYTAPLTILVLHLQGNLRKATELLAGLLNLPLIPLNPVMDWLEHWPLMQRLRADMEATLGTPTFMAAWTRGKSLDLETEIKPLVMDFIALFSAAPPQPTANDALPDPLTNRELEVLELLAEGLSNSAIAERLVIAPSTAKWYVSDMFTKLGVNSRTQLLARARELGILP